MTGRLEDQDMVVSRLVETTAQNAERLHNIRYSFPLTDDQQTLKMDPWMVYLAALCCLCHSSNKMNTTSTDMLRRKRFTKLQQLAVVATSQGDKDSNNIHFSWSPRLSSPTAEQLERVQKDITEMKHRLENNANRVAEELQLSADSDKANKTTTTRENLRTKKKNKRPTQATKTVVEEETDTCEVEPENKETLQDLIQQRLGEVDENFDSINHEEDWVPVIKKNSKGRAVGRNDTAKSSADVTIGTKKQRNELEEDIFSDAADDPSTCGVVSSLTLPSPPLEDSAKEPPVDQEESVSAISIHIGNGDENVTQQSATETSAAARASTTDSQDPDPQQRRIRELEQQLSALQQQHAKTLRNQREHYDDLIQSLQLRLYISETRLKTYEQALEDHVQAVQANMAPSSSPHRSRSKSGAIDNEDVMHVPASSPTLIAKAMEKNNGGVIVQAPDSKDDAVSTQNRRGKPSSKSTTMATSLFAMILCLSIVLVALPVPVRAANPFSRIGRRTRKVEEVRWTEEIDGELDLASSAIEHKTSRRRFMLGQFRAFDLFGSFSTEEESSSRRSDKKLEHPLGTEKWEFDIHWTAKAWRSDRHEKLRMELLLDADVRASAGNATTTAFIAGAPPMAVGQWSRHPWGVRIVVRPLETGTEDSSSHTNKPSPQRQSLYVSQDQEWILFSPAFHPNPFGKYPKLTKGTIIQRKPSGWIDEQNDDTLAQCLLRGGIRLQQWFRPVVGTFSARGNDEEK